MASGGAEKDDGGIPLDIDNRHMLLQVEQEQIQKRTFTNWINAQLSKRCPPSSVADLFSDLRDGSQLLNLLEVMSGQRMKRQRGHGVFQQRADIETALNFLKRKSVKLVNINISDIIDGRPSIILGLIWTIVLHCHIEELASTLSYSSCHSSLDSLASLDSWSGSPIPASPVPAGHTSPLHKRFRMSAKKVLLMWVRDQCQKVGCSVSVRDFKSSWRSGEAFLAILCSLRPELVDLSLVPSRSNQENLEEAFRLAESELHIPRLLDPQDVDVKDPEEKSIMTYVAQFLQYSKDMPAPEDHLQLFPQVQPSSLSPVDLPPHFTPAIAVSPLRQVSPCERAREVTCWLQKNYQELSEARMATEESTFAEKYHVFKNYNDSFLEQRRPVMTLFAAIKRSPELIQEQFELRTAWDRLEEELRICKADLDSSLPPPLDSVVSWLQRADSALAEKTEAAKDHADAAKDARVQQDRLQILIREMSRHVNILDKYHNADDAGNVIVPFEKFDEIKGRLTNIRVTAKYQGIKLEYQESHHTVLDLLGRVGAKVKIWKAPFKSQETVLQLLQDWHETVERQGLLLILMDALQKLKEKANAYTSKAALGEDSQRVTSQVKEADSEAELLSQTTAAVRVAMDRAVSVWETYSKCLTSLQTWLVQKLNEQAQSPAEDMSGLTSCHALLNEAGNLLIEVTDSSTSRALSEQLAKVNMQWAECRKRTMFEVPSKPSVGPPCLQTVRSLTQEASWLLRQPLEVSSVTLKANRQKLQLLSKKMADVDVSSLSPSPDFQRSDIENFKQTLPQMLGEAERVCGDLQRASSGLEGRLAELDHWSTEALDCHQHLKERKQRGRPALDPTAKGLISRGLTLEKQVVMEGQDLRELVTRVQKSSPLQQLSTGDMQDRISEAVSHCQEILGLFTSLGFQGKVEPTTRQTLRHPAAGSVVVARTKNVDLIGNVTLQTPDPNQAPDKIPTPTPKQRTRVLQGRPNNQRMSTQNQSAVVVSHVQMVIQPVREPVPHAFSPFAQTVIVTDSEPKDSVAKAQNTYQPKGPKSPVLSELVAGFPEERESPSTSQTQITKSSITVQQTNPQGAKTSPKPPLMMRSEVHLKAQLMARSRLEKARFRLQGRIQHAIKLFSGREISEPQAKRRQRALKILQPEYLDEFLGAVDGLGAFCSGPALQDLMLLSQSVRKQWEAAVDGSADERATCLRELSETLTPRELTCLATDQLVESAEPSDTAQPSDSGGQQLIANAPLGCTGASADTWQVHSLPQRQSVDDLSPVESAPSVRPRVHIAADMKQQKEKHPKPILRAKEQQLTARLLHITDGNQKTQAHIQAVVVRGNTAERKQEAEWTVIPEISAQNQEVPERVTSLENTTKQMESTDDQILLITERLDWIFREPVDVSAFTLADPKLVSELQEMDNVLERERTKLSERGPEAPSSVCKAGHLQQLRQRLDRAQSAARALDCFLAAVRAVKAEMPTLPPADPDVDTRPNHSARESWQAAMRQKIQAFALPELSDSVDSALKAAGMTLTADGATVSCQDVVAFLSRRPLGLEKEARGAGKRDSKDELIQIVKEQIEESKELNPLEIHRTKTVNDSPQGREKPSPSRMEKEAVVEAKKIRLEGDSGAETHREGVHIVETSTSEGHVLKAKDNERRVQVKRADEKESLVWRRVYLLRTLREIRTAAEKLELKESTLPALQHRTRAFTELDSRLVGHLADLTHIQSEIHDVTQSKELRDAWEETNKAVTEGLGQCNVLTELLKRFQSVRGELSGVLQRAESTISEQASYMGKDNMHRLHTQVQETKAELSGLGHGIDEFRSICRQLHTYLHQIPQCTSIPFEAEADALMDRWLDISERTESHLESLQLSLTLWEGVLGLGEEVDSWIANKLALFTESLTSQTEDNIRALQSEILCQEENMERFHRKAAEIQRLLQSSEPPLELQVVETQMRKKMEQLKELVSEAEDVNTQMVAAKGQMADRMAECFDSLQKIQDSLRTLCGSDVTSVLAKLKDLLFELQSQDEQAESLLEDLRVLAAIASPVSLQSLSEEGIELQEKVRNSHLLFSEVEEQTEKNIRALDRLQRESKHLELWLKSAEKKASKKEDLSLLQEEVLQQREKTEDLTRLLSSLQSSSLQRSAVVEETVKLLERYRNFHTNVLTECKEKSSQMEDSPLDAKLSVQSPTEQRLHNNQAEVRAGTDGGAAVDVTMFDENDRKQDVQEEQPMDLQKAVQPQHSNPEVDKAFTSSYRNRREDELQHTTQKGVRSRLGEAVCDEERFGQLVQDCRRKLTTLQDKMPAQKQSPDGAITDIVTLKALQQEMAEIEKDFLQIEKIKESTAASSTAEVQTSLSQEVTDLRSHKRALDNNIRERLALITENTNHRVEQVKEEINSVQTELKDLAGIVESLDENQEDINQLKQRWYTLKDCDPKLKEVTVRISDLRKSVKSDATQEALPAEVMSTVDTVVKEIDRLGSVLPQKKQLCSENTANRVRHVISQLQTWSQAVQTEPSQPTQEAVDEGLQLQRALQEVLSERDFLLNCLGKNVVKKLRKRASVALSESTDAMETLTKCLVSPAQCEVDSDKDSTGVSEDTLRTKSDAPCLTSPDGTLATCPPAQLAATNNEGNSAGDLNDNRIKTKGTLDTAQEGAHNSNQFPCEGMPDFIKPKTKQASQKSSTHLEINMKTKEDCGTSNTDSKTLSRGDEKLSGNKTEPLMSDSISNSNKSLKASRRNPGPLQDDFSSTQNQKYSATYIDNTKGITSTVGHQTKNPDDSTSDNVSQLPAAHSETVADARDRDRHCEDISVTPKKVFSIVLDIEPKDMMQTEQVDPDVSSQGLPKKKSKLFTTLISPQSDKTDAKQVFTGAQKSGYCFEGLGAKEDKVYTIVLDIEPPDFMQQWGTSGIQDGAEVCDAKVTDVSPKKISKLYTTLTSPRSNQPPILKDVLSKSQLPVSSTELTSTELEKSASANLAYKDTHGGLHTEVECQLPDAHAAEITFQNAKEKTMDFIQAEEQRIRSGLGTEKGGALNDTQAGPGACAPKNTDTGHVEREMTEEPSDLSGPESQPVEGPQRTNETLLSIEQSEWKKPGSLDDTEETQQQPQMGEGMESERTAPSLPASQQAGDTTGGSMESGTHKSTMQDVLSGIQSSVDTSNIINRTPHIDLNWYLKSTPSEPEIRLVRTVQKILACRYQPAQLDVIAMAKQLQDAEDYRCCVQDQVANMKSRNAAGISDPDALTSIEGVCSAALLDASATVQVKAAQLNQVQHYHKQMKVTRAFLEVLTVEKDKMSLNTLRSSALQADRLGALLQTMVQKKYMLEELLHLSSHLSVHLSDAESSGALLAQLGDVQEEWRLLEGSIKRALQHATSSTTQFCLLIKEVKNLKAKLEALQKTDFQSHGSKSVLDFVCLATDLKLCNQLYLHLKSESDALVHFSLGQKEKDEIKSNLQELLSLQNVSKSKLDTSSYSSDGTSSTKISKHLQDLIIWAKQAENHISIGKKLALFPEEARIQIVEMKKSQTDIWSKRSRMQAEVEQLKSVASGMAKEEGEVFKTVDDLYEAIGDSLDQVLDTMKKQLQQREKLLFQLANMDAWLAETHAKRDPCGHVENVTNADLRELESELEVHKSATTEIENQLKLVDAMAENCRELEEGLSPGESRYLVNRLSGIWTDLDGLLALEKATSWDLEELIHERSSSDEELSTIQSSLQQISTDLQQQRFPIRKESLSTFAHWKRLLMEHQFQVQELQHCQEAKRSSVLCIIGELQDQCKTLSNNALEQEKYMHLKQQMEESRDIAKDQFSRAKEETISMRERFGLCQTLLVEIPLVKTQCQEAADQLESIAQELNPSELDSERQRIRNIVETLVSLEDSVTNDIRHLEAKFLQGLHMSSELPALIEFFQKTRLELEGAEAVCPDEKAIDIALRRYWVIWRNIESGIRVLEGLATKEKITLEKNEEPYSLRDLIMQDCHLRMDCLSKARESLKDYQWAAQGAIGFLHHAEATFLSAPGGFMDCTEEQRQTREALEALENGFQAHILDLVELVPQQPSLSRPKTEELHISILSQLLVGRATLEAQAKLRLESLQRCEMRKESHRKCHEDIRQRLSWSEAKLSECAAEQVTSYGKCVAQQKRAKLLMEDLRSLAAKIDELRHACPMQGCGVGKAGELGALWRRWVSLRRGVGLLMAHTDQRGEEWKDITKSMEQCCSFLASLQADVPDSSIVGFSQEEPQELLAQAEMCQVGLEKEQQALASLEHRLEHALSLSSSHEPTSPGPVGKTLVKIQENVRSLKERNLLVVSAAQEEEKERQQIQEEIGELEKHLLAIHPSIESIGACASPNKQQELKEDLTSQRAKLKCIGDSVDRRYAEIPTDISKKLQEIELYLQKEEEKLMETNNPVRKVDSQVTELVSGLERVKVLLEQRGATVNEAQKVNKRVWDELDLWHSRLMLLESQVQDLAVEHPDHAHLLMDQLTQPLQLYQDTAQRAEQRTAFLSKIPVSLQEFDGNVHSATSWLDEAQTWISAPGSFSTARSLQSHASSLQLVLDDSQRIRHSLQDFKLMLDQISAVCDTSAQKEKLNHNDQQLDTMQHKIMEQLEPLLQAVEVVETMEGEIATMEKNVPKIRAILSVMENSNITLAEHLNNRQVILANVQSMRRTLEDMEACKGQLPQGAQDSLLVFSKAKVILHTLEELQQLSQQQTTMLQSQIKEAEADGSKASDVNTVPDTPEEAPQQGTSPHTHPAQEAYEASNAEEEEEEKEEEEEEEENQSCHSSSSDDTLTGSFPEDPEETLSNSDVQSEDIAEKEPLADHKEVERSSGQFSSDVEMSTVADESEHLMNLKPDLDTEQSGSENVETGLITMEPKAEVGEGFKPEAVTAEPQIAAVAEELVAGTEPDRQTSDRPETRADDLLLSHSQTTAPGGRSDLQAERPQTVAPVEDTAGIPVTPVAPLTTTSTTSDELTDLATSTDPHQDVGTASVLKEQSAVLTSQSIAVVESQQTVESSKEPISSAGYQEEEDDMEQPKWGRLYTQTSQKLATLEKLNEDRQISISSVGKPTHEKVSEKEHISTRSASCVLQQTNASITTLRQMVSCADVPAGKEELYAAVRRVTLCLDTLTHFMKTPGDDEPCLRLLQQECVSADVRTLSDLLNKVESQNIAALSKEDPEAVQCLSSLKDCLHTVQLLFTSSQHDITEHLDVPYQELPFDQTCLLDKFEPGQSETFPGVKDPPSLEQCLLGRHHRQSPGETAKLQQASRSLLQGMTGLLELGEECIAEGQKDRVHNRSQLQAVLSRNKLLQVLDSQWAYIEHLFQKQPDVLRCQEDHFLQLGVRAKALHKLALEQEVAAHRTMQEWTRWEESSSGLSRLLDDAEVSVSVGPEAEDDEFIQNRRDACRQTLAQLDESRAALGLTLDQSKGLPAAVGHTTVGLQKRWQSVYTRTEQEIQRCTQIQDSGARLQTGFDSVTDYLVSANTHLKTWSELEDSPDLNQESVHSNLIKLLDFSMEVEAMSVQRGCVSAEATRLLHMREADCPGIRAQLAQLEAHWSQLTSDTSKIQEKLQQRLLETWPPVELLSALEVWLEKTEARVNQEKEAIVKAEDAAHVMESLHKYQELRAGVSSGQLLGDFLCQSGPQLFGVEVQAHSEHTAFAEKLGELRWKWLLVQTELDSQIHAAQQTHHTCADRERRLHRLHTWMEQQKKRPDEWHRPTCQTVAHNVLLELEATESKLQDVSEDLQKLKAIRVNVEGEEDRPCDTAFSAKTKSVCQACEDLSQQMESLKAAVQQTVKEWSCFDRDLREVSLHTIRLRCALQHQLTPLYSLEQAQRHRDLLQKLQEEAGIGAKLWASLDKSHQCLVKSVHHGAAQTNDDKMEEERKRWKDVLQELKDEQDKSRETLPLWQKFILLSDQTSHGLHTLWSQYEDTHISLQTVQHLQAAAEELQSNVGDVLDASKPLIGRLRPLAMNQIQSETRMLSRDVLLLSQAVSGKKRSLQDDLELQEHIHTHLEALEEQIQNIQQDKDSSMTQTDVELSNVYASLVDIREMSDCVALNDQDKEKLQRLCGRWAQSMTHTSAINRERQTEHQLSLNFEQKCENLASLQKRLEEEIMSKKPKGYSNLQEMLSVYQRLQAETCVGHELQQELLRHAVQSMDKETGEERSKLMAQVTRVRESWLKSVTLVDRWKSSAKEQVGHWRVYNRGLKYLWKLLRDVDPLLPPAGPAVCSLHQLRSCADDYKCVEDALSAHSGTYSQTLQAGRRLCETVTEAECRGRLQAQLQHIQEAWEQTASLLGKRKELVDTTAQKWSQFQDLTSTIMRELDELKTALKESVPEKPHDSEDDKHIQGVSGRLRELSAMKTDLSQYVAAGDSALLETQLGQLHGQWEELRMKVSSRRQEIADRLNAWTIFNDKNKEFCEWLTQMENKVCHTGDLSIEEMVEKLKKDCMEEINLFSENKSHLKQLGEQLLLASDQAKQSRVNGSLQEVNLRWHNLFHHIEARVKKLKETLVTVQQLDKNMSNLRSWLSRIQSDLSRPITYSVCHHHEIQRRLAEQQELQRDMEQHTEGVASVLSLCDVLLRDEDAAGGPETESHSLQETSRSLDQRWRTICALALDRRLRIEETWRLWCKFLDDYSRFEDWLKMAERTASNPNSADVLYTVAKEELKKFEGFQRQVHERLTQLELVNNQYRRLARENRTDRASQLKVMVTEGNRRWDVLHRRVAGIIRRLKHFTSQREEFEGTRESMLVWLTELDLQLTNVEHFSESDVHHKIQQLNSFQKEIRLNTERIDGLIVDGEGLIQRSSPEDAALIEDELEELHSYCQEVFSRLVRFHQRLSQPPMVREEPELTCSALSMESSMELIGRPWLGRGQGGLPATPSHLCPLERWGRETPADSLPLEWDHTGDVGGSTSHEDNDDEEDDEDDEARTYYSALSDVELTEIQEEFVEASEALQASSLVSGRSMSAHGSPRWHSQAESPPDSPVTSTPLKQGYFRLMTQCSGSIEDIKRVSLILDDEEQPEELGLTGLSASDKQSGVIERWELLQARSRSDRPRGPEDPLELTSDLRDITSWLEKVIPELERLQQSDPAAGIEDMADSAKKLKEMQKMFARHKSTMLTVNLRAESSAELQERLASMNRDWSTACTGLQQWDHGLRKTLMRCQEFHETLHSMLLWLALAESRRYAVDITHPDTPVTALQLHRNTLTDLQAELRGRQSQQASLQALWSQLQPDDEPEENHEAREKLHVTGSKLKLLLRQVDQDLGSLMQRLDCESASGVQAAPADPSKGDTNSKKGPSSKREQRDSSPPRSFFYRVLRAAFPLHLLLLFLLLLPCLMPLSDSEPGCSGTNNFARSFYPMLRYTNGPPPT